MFYKNDSKYNEVTYISWIIIYHSWNPDRIEQNLLPLLFLFLLFSSTSSLPHSQHPLFFLFPTE